MGLRIFSQVVFGATVLLIGQLSIGGETIGHRFLSQISKGSLWIVGQVKRSKIFADVMDVKEKAQQVEKTGPKAIIEAGVEVGMERSKESIGDIGKRLENARVEALEGLKRARKKAAANGAHIEEEEIE